MKACQHYPGYRGTGEFHERYVALTAQAGRPRLTST